IATFNNLSIDKAGAGYTLTASGGGASAGATSNKFDVTVGVPDHLAFAQQPTNTAAGATIAPAVTVRVEDSLGNLVTTASGNLALAIGTNPGGGTLSGTTSQPVSGGIATFNDLSINRSGVGYTLTASGGGA